MWQTPSPVIFYALLIFRSSSQLPKKTAIHIEWWPNIDFVWRFFSTIMRTGTFLQFSPNSDKDRYRLPVYLERLSNENLSFRGGLSWPLSRGKSLSTCLVPPLLDLGSLKLGWDEHRKLFEDHSSDFPHWVRARNTMSADSEHWGVQKYELQVMIP